MDFKHGAAGRVKKTIPEIPSSSAHAAPPFCHFDRSEGAWRNLTLKWCTPQWVQEISRFLFTISMNRPHHSVSILRSK